MDGDIKQKSHCPTCGHDFDEEGAPWNPPVETVICPVCGEKTDPADLITEDDDYSWVL